MKCLFNGNRTKFTIIVIAVVTLIVQMTGCSNIDQPSADSIGSQTFESSPSLAPSPSSDMSSALVVEPSSTPDITTSVVSTAIPTDDADISSISTETAIPSNDTFDSNNYAKLTWVDQNSDCNSSFCITNISNGQISGIFVPGIFGSLVAVPGGGIYSYGEFSGTLSDGKAKCKFSGAHDIQGSLLLIFEPNNQIQVTISLSQKSSNGDNPKEGTFEYIPYNICNVEGIQINEAQSFKVNLNSWGDVRFISAVGIESSHRPNIFYLTDKDGNILFDFASYILPGNSDVLAVSFKDVNNDGLKDVIIIVGDGEALINGDDSYNRVAVFQQASDGTFFDDPNLDVAINWGGYNKDISTVVQYLASQLPQGVQPQPQH